MAINAEQLNIILAARDKEFTKAMDRSQKRVERFAKKSQKNLSNTGESFKKLSSAAKRLAPVLAAAFGVQAIRGSIEAASEIDKLSRLAGVSVERFQLLAATSKQFGVEQEKLADILKDVNDKFGDFTQTGAGPLADFFENIAPKVGLTSAAFADLSSDAKLGAYISALEDANVSQSEMTFYMEAIASDSTALVAAFQNNSSAIKEMEIRAKELGFVLDKETIEKATKAKQEIGLMSQVISSELSQALIDIAPLLVSASQGFASLVSDFSTFFRVMNSGMKYSDDFVAGLVSEAVQAGNLTKELEALSEANNKLRTEGLEGRPHMTPDLVEAYEDAVKALEDALNAPQAALDLQAETAEKVRLAAAAALASAQDEVDAAKESARTKEIGAKAAERERIEREKQALMDRILAPYAETGFTTEAVAAREEAQRLGKEFEVAETAASRILNPIKKIAPAIEDTRSELQKMIDQMIKASPYLESLGFDAENLHSVMQTVEGSMESAFMAMVDGTMSTKDAFRSMASDIIKELYRVLVVQKMVSAVSGFIGGTFGASPAITGAASGRSVNAGQPYVTGEHGREIFVPSSAGRVLSLAQSKSAINGGGDGVVVNQTINVSTGVQQTVRTEIKQLMPQIAESAKSAVVDAKRRGGSYGRAFS
jgi:hypothetical protein